MANVFLQPVQVPGLWGDPPMTLGAPTVPVDLTLPAVENSALATRPKAIAWVKMAPDILRAMALAANHGSRTVSEVWAEAAREWLLRKALDADYDVLAYAPAKKRPEDAQLEAKHQRLWGSIDAAMATIRDPASVVE